MEIYIRKNGEGTGPFSVEQVEEALARGDVGPKDQAWHSDESCSMPLSLLLKVEKLKVRDVESSTVAQKTARGPAASPGEWEVLCPQCVKIIGTPASLSCPNCQGPLELEGGFTTRLKCVRCSTAVTDVRCDTCKSLASGEYIRRTALGVRTFNTAADEASLAVCPACRCNYTNKIRDTGCATVFWFLVSLPFLLIPYFIYAFVARYQLPNTKCLGCGHEWNAKVNRGG